jgi:hypothetical protein
MCNTCQGRCRCGVRACGVGNDMPIGTMFGVNLGASKAGA